MTYAKFTNCFEKAEDPSSELRSVISETTFGAEMPVDHPMTEKLAIYTLAHKNYLASLSQEDMREYKINWGLRQTQSLEE